MPSVDVNGQTIVYEESGEGPALLLVMGLAGQLIDWPAPFVEQLESRYRVIRFDNRDIGLSSQTAGSALSPLAMFWSFVSRRRPRSGYLLSDMADDAVGLLDALSVDQAHIVGISMGGMICQEMAIRHPSRVLTMTSIMSNTGDRRNGRSAPSLLARLARFRQPTRDTAVEQFVETSKLLSGPHWDETIMREGLEASIARSYRPEGVARQMAAINASPDRTEKLAAVTAPTLVIHGLVDPLVKPSGGIATANAVPGSRLLMFPDMAHDLPRSRLAEIVAAIDQNTARAQDPART